MKKKPSTQAPKPTNAEMRVRLSRTEEVLSLGWRHSMVIEALRKEYGIGIKAAEKLVTRIYKRWAKLDEKGKPERRAAQLNRLYRMLEQNNPTIIERVRIETLIAKIEGNLAPIEVGGINQEPIKLIVE